MTRIISKRRLLPGEFRPQSGETTSSQIKSQFDLKKKKKKSRIRLDCRACSNKRFNKNLLFRRVWSFTGPKLSQANRSCDVEWSPSSRRHRPGDSPERYRKWTSTPETPLPSGCYMTGAPNKTTTGFLCVCVCVKNHCWNLQTCVMLEMVQLWQGMWPFKERKQNSKTLSSSSSIQNP